MKTIYVFGNLLLDTDNIPLRIMPKLQNRFPQIQFMSVDPNEDFPPKDEFDIIVLDTIQSIREVGLYDFSDLAAVTKSPISPHDYDLLLHLLLLKKMGKIHSPKIIGMPMGINLHKAFITTVRIISTLL